MHKTLIRDLSSYDAKKKEKKLVIYILYELVHCIKNKNIICICIRERTINSRAFGKTLKSFLLLE